MQLSRNRLWPRDSNAELSGDPGADHFVSEGAVVSTQIDVHLDPPPNPHLVKT